MTSCLDCPECKEITIRRRGRLITKLLICNDGQWLDERNHEERYVILSQLEIKKDTIRMRKIFTPCGNINDRIREDQPDRARILEDLKVYYDEGIRDPGGQTMIRHDGRLVQSDPRRR